MPEEVKFECTPENAPRFWYWLHRRGGIANWRSVDLSDLNKSWSTPALTKEGQPMGVPHWKCGPTAKPVAICADPDKVQVITDKEVERFHVAIRRGSQGLSLKLTDASSARLKKKLAKWSRQCNNMASYHFDYDFQDAVITIPDKILTLTEWAAANPELADRAKAADSAVVDG